MIEAASRLGTVRAPTTGAADVWFVRVGDHVADVDRFSRDLLSEDERERVRAYRSREIAERYVVTRSLVRSVLSEALGIPSSAVAVARTETGKPVVGGVHFNVSHSGDLILLAVSGEREVGIDLERRRDIPRVEALIERWFTRDEREDVGRRIANGAEISEAFLRVWSFKEARLKALGVGISGASSASYRAVDAVPLDELLDQLTAPGEPGYVGAVAFA